MQKLLEQVENTITRHGLLRDGQKVLLAVSGGLDSMVLLHVVHRLSKKHRWKLVVAHFNHKLRGRSADADEKFVARAAKELGLDFASARADVRQFSRQSRLSIEMAARKLRHDFLARTARSFGIRTIALAHHADDQVETFFLRLLRGAGSEGLAGMKSKGQSPGDPTIETIRPLLHQSKSALRDFAKRENITFREDASNATMDFQRNRIRRELLPLLRQFQPALDKTILRVMEILRADAEFTSDAAGKLRRAKRFDALPVAIQRRCLQSELIKSGFAPDFDLIEFLRANPRQAISVAPRMSVFHDGSGRVVLSEASSSVFDTSQATVNLKGRSGTILFSDVEISWKLGTLTRSRPPQRTANTERFDADKVGSKIVLRHWQRGDRFQPIGMNRAVKLQDLFTNEKIPRDERHRLIVAATATGDIFWVEKLRIGEAFKLTPDTSRALKWQWERH